MNNEQYKKLNDYLNDLFIKLEKNDFFLLNNIPNIAYLSSNLLNISDEYEIKSIKKENKLTFEDVYLLCREIIESIDKKYLDAFDNLLTSGELEFDFENKLLDSYYEYDRDKKLNLINIKREFSYSDVISLIHEYFHYINGKDGNGINRYLLTEFLSIYFEMYAMEYLLNKGIDKEEIGYNDRIIATLNSSDAFLSYAFILLSYKQFGSVDKKHIPLINEYFCDITEEESEKESLKLLNKIEEMKKNYKFEIMYEKVFSNEEFIQKLSDLFSKNYRYILGTLLSIYARENSDIKDIIFLNDHINDYEFVNSNLDELINKIGININENDFNSELLSSYNKYIEKYNFKKGKKK